LLLFKKKYNFTLPEKFSRRFLWIAASFVIALVAVSFFFSIKSEYLRRKAEDLVSRAVRQSASATDSSAVVSVGHASLRLLLPAVTIGDVKIETPHFLLKIPYVNLSASFSRLITARPFIIVKIKNLSFNLKTGGFFSYGLFSSSSSTTSAESDKRHDSSPLLGPVGSVVIDDGVFVSPSGKVIFEKIYTHLRSGGVGGNSERGRNTLAGILRATGGKDSGIYKNATLFCRFHGDMDDKKELDGDIFLKGIALPDSFLLASLGGSTNDVKIKFRYLIPASRLEIENLKILNSAGIEIKGSGWYRKESDMGFDGVWNYPVGIFKEGVIKISNASGADGMVDIRIFSGNKNGVSPSGQVAPHRILNIGVRADLSGISRGEYSSFRIFTTTDTFISGIPISALLMPDNKNNEEKEDDLNIKNCRLFLDTFWLSRGREEGGAAISSATFSFSCDISSGYGEIVREEAVPFAFEPSRRSRHILGYAYYSSHAKGGGRPGADIKIEILPSDIKCNAHITADDKGVLIDGGMISSGGGDMSYRRAKRNLAVPSGKINFSGQASPLDIRFDSDGFEILPLMELAGNFSKRKFHGRFYIKGGRIRNDAENNWRLYAHGIKVKGFSVADGKDNNFETLDFSADVEGGADSWVVKNFATERRDLTGSARIDSSGYKKIELYASRSPLPGILSPAFGLEGVSGLLDGRLDIEVSTREVPGAGAASVRINGAADISVAQLALNGRPVGNLSFSAKFYPSLKGDSNDIFFDKFILRPSDNLSPATRGGGSISGGFSVVNGRLKGLFGFSRYAVGISSDAAAGRFLLDGRVTATGSFKNPEDFEIKFVSPGFSVLKNDSTCYKDDLSFTLYSGKGIIGLSGLKYGVLNTTTSDGITISEGKSVANTGTADFRDKIISGGIAIKGLPLKTIADLFVPGGGVANGSFVKNGMISELTADFSGSVGSPRVRGIFRVDDVAIVAKGKSADEGVVSVGNTSWILRNDNSGFLQTAGRLIGNFDYVSRKNMINLSARMSFYKPQFRRGEETGYIETSGAISGDGVISSLSVKSEVKSLPDAAFIFFPGTTIPSDYSSAPLKANFRITGKLTDPVVEGEAETTSVKNSKGTVADRIKVSLIYSDGKLNFTQGLFRNDFAEVKLQEGSYLDVKTGNYKAQILVGRLKAGFLSAIGRLYAEGRYLSGKTGDEISSGSITLEDFWIGAGKFSREKILFKVSDGGKDIVFKTPPEIKTHQFSCGIKNLSFREAAQKGIFPSVLKQEEEEKGASAFYNDKKMFTFISVDYKEPLAGAAEEDAGATGASLGAEVLIKDVGGKNNSSASGIFVKAKTSRFPAEKITRFLSDETPLEVSGLSDINLDMEIGGDGISGEASVELSRGETGGISFDSIKAVASLADGILVVPSAQVVKDGSYRITASGRLALPLPEEFLTKNSAPAKNDFTISLAEGRLSMFEGLGFVKKADGALSARLDIKGTRKDPRVTGFIKIENATAELKMYLARVQNLNMLATFKDNLLNLEELSGRSGVGRFLLKGTARLENFAVTDMDFSFKNTTAGEGIDLFVPELPIPTQFSRETGVKFISSYSYGKPKFDLTIKGDPRARITLAGWVRLDNTYFSYPPPPPASYNVAEDPLEPTLRKLELDLTLSSGENTWYENELASVNIDGKIHLKGNYYAPYVSGSIESKRGYISYLGTDFKIQTARLEVAGEEAYLEGTATKEIASAKKGYETVNLIIDRALIGKIQPRFVSSEDPSLASDKVVAKVLGVNVENSSPEERDLVLRQGLVRLLDSSLATPFAKTLLRKSGLVDMMKVSYAQPVTGASGGESSDTSPAAASQGLTSAGAQGSALPDLLRGTKYTFEKYLTDQMLLGYSVTLDEYLNKLDLKHEIEVAYRWKGNVFLRGLYELDSKTLIRPPERRITIEQQWRFGWPKKDNKSGAGE